MISLTKTAAEQIHQAAKDANAENTALRIAAKVNQAGMLEFGMGFDDERTDDTLVESWGVTLLISKHSLELLDDVTVDFNEVAPGQNSFIFMKPETEGGGCSTGGSGGGCGSGGCGSGGCGS